MKIRYKFLALFMGTFLLCSPSLIGQDAASIFKQNCGACHKLGQRLVGPDLLGVNEKRDAEWLMNFIKSPKAMVDAGDETAVALLAEFNQIMMTDQAHLGDDQINSILAYIDEETQARNATASSGEEVEVVEEVPIVYTAEDVEAGLNLFSGKMSLTNGGPSCVTCHNVTNDQLISGGLLAKDLTNAYERMGGDAGVAGIIGTPPFPAMATAYANNEISDEEVFALTAFLKHADEVSETQIVNSGASIFLFGGGGGLIVLFIIIALLWKNRIRQAVKHDIFKRQLKGNDSVILK